MKKAVITICGLIGVSKPNPNKDGEPKFILKTEEDKALYTTELKTVSLETKKHYINMLPLLFNNFGNDYDIIALATKKAKTEQIKVLEFEKLKDDEIIFQDIEEDKATEYSDYFKMVNTLLNEYQEVIVDLSHGFRHLPILTLINLIIQNIKNPSKIKHILFAQEIVPNKEYKIIDLRDYLGLAKLTFVLANFNENYTIGNQLIFNNPNYQELVDRLRIISGHILGNSIKALIDGDDSLVEQTVKQFEALMQSDQNIKNFSSQIDEIIKHLQNIQDLKNEEHYMKLFKLSQMMSKREYLLNSITLLNESIGLYCAKKLGSISDEIQKHINKYLDENDGNLYELAHQSKNIIKNGDEFKGAFLFEPTKPKLTSGQKTALQEKKKKLKGKIPSSILDEIKSGGFKIELSEIDNISDKTIKNQIISHVNNNDYKELRDIIIAAEKLRNNLAHGNSSDEIGNVKAEITKILKRFENLLDA